MNSQNTKAVGGSNCSDLGASRFQLSQSTVQVRIRKKKPMVPTRVVIQTASLSSDLRFCFSSLLMSCSGGCARLHSDRGVGGVGRLAMT